MRLWIGVVAAFVGCVFTTASSALECRYGGSTEPINISQWETYRSTFKDIPGIRYSAASTLSRPVRMIDAYVRAQDALGRVIVESLEFPPDQPLAPSSLVEVETLFPTRSSYRLLDANPTDITVAICTRAVVYDDGSTQTFE